LHRVQTAAVWRVFGAGYRLGYAHISAILARFQHQTCVVPAHAGPIHTVLAIEAAASAAIRDVRRSVQWRSAVMGLRVREDDAIGSLTAAR
jgi:hypothetical protein